jgi:transglutaminase-like putative cysteine protease
MQWRLVHTTKYRFPEPVQLGPHEVRLRPCDGAPTRLEIWPRPSVAYWRRDLWENWVFQVWFRSPMRELTISNRLRYRPVSRNPFDFVVENSALLFPPQTQTVWAPYLQVQDGSEDFLAWVEQWRRPGVLSTTLATELNRAIHDQIRYVQRDEPGTQSPEFTLRERRGACRDTAWLLVQTLRGLGYAARYVSGYWLQLESSRAELHAWAELFLPGAGWFGLDPTAGLAVAEQHLALAHAPTPQETAPVQGSHSQVAGSELEFRLRVRKRS